MIRFIFPIVTIAAITSLVACSDDSPVADEANNAATTPAEVDVLPPDESVATPTNELENGDDDPVVETTNKIPAAFQGRWGLSPADCVSDRPDTKGLLIISGDTLRFYEAQARPAGELKQTDDSISGEFAFSGEGKTWRRYQVLEMQGNKLVRTDSAPMASYTYARCTS
jgi:hypothetical protein